MSSGENELGIFPKEGCLGPVSDTLAGAPKRAGERLELRRLPSGDEVWLELRGSLPPYGEGPPLHIHFEEDEEGTVHSGKLSAVVDGRSR